MPDKIILPDAPPALVIPDLSQDLDGFIRKFVKLRDIKSELKAKHTAELRPYNDAIEMLEAGFLKVLIDTKTDSASAKGAGTVYRTTRKSAVIDDGDSFRRHCIGSEDWDLVDWKANAVQVHTRITETNLPVPGVRYSEEAKVGIRRA